MAHATNLRRGAAALALVLAGGAAQAGLLEDDEARKAILDLRARLAQAEEQSRARAAESASANAQLLEQVASLRRSLLDLNNAIEQNRQELARLRGSDEQLLREISELQKRQTDFVQAMDARLRVLEPTKVTLDGKEFSARPEEKREFEDALAVLRSGQFDAAAAAFAAMLRRYPSSGYADAARYWQANALYGKRDYKEAIVAFRQFVAAAPNHPRAADAMLAMANSQAEMKDPRAARKTLEDLMKAYPDSDAALAGRERLAALR